jgi:hypothetical protein
MISIGIDTSGVDPLLRRFERRVASAAATALTRTVQSAKGRIEREMPRVFDRPTAWTLRSLRIETARRDKLSAAVFIKDRDAGDVAGEKSHLWPQIRGGQRRHKAFEARLRRQAWIDPGEYLAPAKGTTLDAYGNMPAGVVRQILSQLGAANAADNSGYDSNVKRGAKQSAQSKRRQLKAGTYFIPRRGAALPRGIYQRKLTGFGWATRMVFAIVSRPSYRPRLPFNTIVEQTRDRELQAHFDAELARISQD